MRYLILLITLTAAGILSSGCGSEERNLPTIETEASFRKDGTVTFHHPSGDTIATIDVEIADTPTAQARGLMGRRSLPPQSGMLFVFEETDTTGFWMRNTPLPLDIIFIDRDGRIINIAERTTPYSDSLILPEAPRQYVVEVRAGYADRLGLTDSTRMTWNRTNDPS